VTRGAPLDGRLRDPHEASALGSVGRDPAGGLVYDEIRAAVPVDVPRGGLAVGQRLYVQRVVPQTQTVVLGPEDSLFQSECLVADLNRFDDSLVAGPRHAHVKVRYATPAAPAMLEPRGDGTLAVRFRTPQRAPAPGQSAVF
jgi:tRNA U34 2-thiouridine synthase MnmA/TrmU